MELFYFLLSIYCKTNCKVLRLVTVGSDLAIFKFPKILFVNWWGGDKDRRLAVSALILSGNVNKQAKCI